MKLQLGKGFREPLILEGRDMYLECVVKANPPVVLVDWYHDGSLLEEVNGTSGFLITGPYLVIRKAQPAHAGVYLCAASNELATARSESILLVIQCEHLYLFFIIWATT